VDSLGAAVAMRPRYQRRPAATANIVPRMPAHTPEQLSREFAEAIGARDVHAALALWSEDAALIQADGQAIRGHVAIESALRALVENGIYIDIRLAGAVAAGDVAIGSGTLTMSGVGADGRPFEHRSESVVVYRRGEDDRWRIALDAPWGLPPS
jgi:uncharacterized protein (TIGR02246 family)